MPWCLHVMVSASIAKKDRISSEEDKYGHHQYKAAALSSGTEGKGAGF